MTDDDSERLKRELARRRDAYQRRVDSLPPQERERLRQMHWMRCPKCGSELEEVVFKAVKVDKCFGCGGVYLDDGELEQLAGKPGWFMVLRDLLSG